MSTLAASTHPSSVHTPSQRSVPAGSEVRGFALYVGVDEASLAHDGTDLESLVTALKEQLAKLAPSAESYAAVALAPEGVRGRSIEVARLALGEPAARARAQKQQQTQAAAAARNTAKGVTVDLTRKRVEIDGEAVSLSFREFELLQFFVLRAGKNIRREDIIETLWVTPNDEEAPNARTIDVHIRRLRIKLGNYHDVIRTVRGIGYRFDRHADVNIVTRSTASPDMF